MSRGLLAAGALAAATAAALHGGGVLGSLEQDSRVVRFEHRAPAPPREVLVVAIDGETGARLGRRWPFPRSWHARAIDELRRLGARSIVYDIQFTEQTEPEEDLALFDAVRRAGNVVLATSELDDAGRHNVLGGEANVREARARVGAANLERSRDARLERLPRTHQGMPTIPVAVAEQLGRPVPRSAFGADGTALIDFAGPPGTVAGVPFWRLLERRVPAAAVRGRVVVVGVTAATEQDHHLTNASHDRLMAGPEVQAMAIASALRGMPLRRGPGWADLAAVVALALLPALAAARRGAPAAIAVAVAAGGAWTAAAFALFAEGVVVALAAPLVASGLGAAAAVGAAWAAERLGRRRSEARGEVLEALVRERTAELAETQLEVIHRLALAAEWRDEDTGAHIERMSRMCERLALAAGLPPGEAEDLGHAAALHDIGKIAIADRILLKPGPLTPEERAVMQTHAEIGARMLAGSSSPLVRLAETVARTHHERWDGTGYPAGLAGEEIPLAGRIAAICDVFDALLARRPYKEPWGLPAALDEIERCAGTQFDPRLVALFLPLGRALQAEREAADAAAAPAGLSAS